MSERTCETCGHWEQHSADGTYEYGYCQELMDLTERSDGCPLADSHWTPRAEPPDD